MSDSLKIGQLITGKMHRDAIHVAVVPVVAGEDLFPGKRVHVSRNFDGTLEANDYGADERGVQGIIDPFLRETVRQGQQCWLFVLPGTITALRHDWTHPAFPSTTTNLTDKMESEAWLRKYANDYSANYDDMVAGAVSGEGYCFGDDDGPPQYRNCKDEFWRHIENVTGKCLSDDHKDGTMFTCGC